MLYGDPRDAAREEGAARPRLRGRAPRRGGLHLRPGHGHRRAVHGLGEGRDRPRRGPAARGRRHPAGRDRRHRFRPAPRNRGGVAVLQPTPSPARVWSSRASARWASTRRASSPRAAPSWSPPPTRAARSMTPSGLDVAALVALKDQGKSVAELGRGRRLDRDALLDVECDIWIPAARPDVIREDNVERLRTQARRLRREHRGQPWRRTPPAREAHRLRARLHRQRGWRDLRGDGVSRSDPGCGVSDDRGKGPRQHRGSARARAERERCLPRDAAVALATGRVRRAMATRRFAIF